MNAIKPITEKQFMAQVTQLAKTLGYLVYHTYNSQRSEPGFPDLVMVKGKRCIFAELKSERGKLTPAQADWFIALRNAGQEAYWWRPSQFNDIVEVLQR